jgi:hypothetical protein
MTDRSSGGPGEGDTLSLLVLFAGDPVGAVTIDWHGDLELQISSSKFFGGKSPGIDNAWQLANLVRRAIEAESPAGISHAHGAFLDGEGMVQTWEITLEDDGA